MTINECYLYVLSRLNKGLTNKGDNIPKWRFVSAFNSQQLLWLDDRIKLDETNTLRKDEIEHLLVTKTNLVPTLAGTNYYELSLPQDYYRYKRSTSLVPCEIANRLVKEGNINTLLLDTNWKPSVEWGETLCTLVGKKLRIYVDNFTISGVNFVYYRQPVKVNMEDGFSDINGITNTNIDSEFEGSSLIEILDVTCELLASDNQDQWNLQTSTQRQRHT